MRKAVRRAVIRTANNILTIAKSGDKYAIFDPSRIDTLFQDTAGATPVTAHTDPVGLMRDLGSGALHATQGTAGNRPLYDTSLGYPMLKFDNSNDVLKLTGNGLALANAASYITVVAAANMTSSGSAATIVFISRNGSASQGRCYLQKSTADKAQVTTRRLDADTGQNLSSTSSVAGATHVLCAEADYQNTAHYISIDAAARETATPTWGAGVAVQNTNSDEVDIGANNSASPANPANGFIGRIFIIDRLLNPSELIFVKRWCGQGAGLAI